jgi:hypothetical protein
VGNVLASKSEIVAASLRDVARATNRLARAIRCGATPAEVSQLRSDLEFSQAMAAGELMLLEVRRDR